MHINVTSYIQYLAVGTLPPHNALQQVAVIGRGTGLSPSGTHKDADLWIGAGLPPRLVARIEAGEFIDMAKLLPDHLGSATTEPLPKPSKWCHDVSNILKWIRCFSAYIAVINTKQPHRIPYLLGYLTLITKAHMQYAGDGWMGNDQRFRQIAATKPHVTWAQNGYHLVEPCLLGQGQICALHQYHAYLNRMWVGTWPRVWFLRNSVPASSFSSTSHPLPCLITKT